MDRQCASDRGPAMKEEEENIVEENDKYYCYLWFQETVKYSNSL